MSKYKTGFQVWLGLNLGPALIRKWSVCTQFGVRAEDIRLGAPRLSLEEDTKCHYCQVGARAIILLLGQS